MLTILDDEFAPITSCAVFLKAPLDRIRATEVPWHRERPPVHTELSGGLREMLPALEPLTGPVTLRRLWVQTRNPEWSVYFTGDIRGTVNSAPGAVHGYCRHLQVPGLEISVCPHTMRRDGTGEYGNFIFAMHGPGGPAQRVIAAQVGDGDRWVFTNFGDLQPFEQPRAYRARRIRDRLTSRMIADYCAALGLYPFEEDFYGPRGLLMEQSVEQYLPAFDPSGLVEKSLVQVQAEKGIVPGAAASLPEGPPASRAGRSRWSAAWSRIARPADRSAPIEPVEPLLAGRFAPTTEFLGFLEADLSTTARALVAWREQVHGPGALEVEHLSGDLASLLSRLDPLDVGPEAATELLVATRGGRWTTVFDSSAADPDVTRIVGALSERLGAAGVVAAWRPHPVETEKEEIDADGQYLDEDVLGGAGVTEFSITDPAAEPPDFYLRRLRAEYAYDQWEFTDDGEHLVFEDPAGYDLDRIPDRLPAGRVAAYCRAVGIDPFVDSFYGPQAVLVRRPVHVADQLPRRHGNP